MAPERTTQTLHATSATDAILLLFLLMRLNYIFILVKLWLCSGARFGAYGVREMVTPRECPENWQSARLADAHWMQNEIVCCGFLSRMLLDGEMDAWEREERERDGRLGASLANRYIYIYLHTYINVHNKFCVKVGPSFYPCDPIPSFAFVNLLKALKRVEKHCRRVEIVTHSSLHAHTSSVSSFSGVNAVR